MPANVIRVTSYEHREQLASILTAEGYTVATVPVKNEFGRMSGWEVLYVPYEPGSL